MDQNRHDDPLDKEKTALICASDVEVQNIASEQLSSLGYKVHMGLFVEDILLKLKSHDYSVVLVDENFDESSLGTNQALAAAIDVSATQRRRQFVVMVGVGLTTNDDMQAFAHNVDLVCNLADLPNLRPVVRRGAARQQEFYSPYHTTLRALETFV